jgi:phage/plasmid-like protein (TIGR03299 family)
MAHEITIRNNGKAEMAYVGEKPWHSLGQELAEGAPIEEWLVAAGMDWNVQRSKVRYCTDAAGATEIWADKHVLFRSDTRAPLGMVSDQFKVVQPRAVLEFFRDLVEVAGFSLETAGTLRGGSRFWAMASINAQDRIFGNDLVKGRLLLATACDGTMNTIVQNVAERVVCANTLAIALGESGGSKIAVSHKLEFKPEQVKRQLGIAVSGFEHFVSQARALAQRQISHEEATRFVARLQTAGKTDFERLIAGGQEEVALIAELQEKDRGFKKIMDLFNGEGRGASLPGVAGTAWGAVNAVTEYVDHFAQARSDSNRMNSAWFGAGSEMKQQAFEAALELLHK